MIAGIYLGHEFIKLVPLRIVYYCRLDFKLRTNPHQLSE
jgi:hypothetical protein